MIVICILVRSMKNFWPIKIKLYKKLYFITQITLITLNTQNDNDIVGVDLAISEIQTTLLYKDNIPCIDYEGNKSST